MSATTTLDRQSSADPFPIQTTVRSMSPSSAASALVLDGQDCHALAGVRSLGRRGVRVVVASPKAQAMSFQSRYCAERLSCPSPADDPLMFSSWLHETLRRDRYDALLFFGEASANIVARHRDEIQALTGCPLPAYEDFLTADRKDRVARLARELGLWVPRTIEIASHDDAHVVAARHDYPAIVKGVQGSGGHQVAFVRDAAELVAAVQSLHAERRDPHHPLPIVQQYVPGKGYGLTALCQSGEPIAVFMHRRLEEHDVACEVRLAHAASGAESIDEPQLREAGLRLLRALRWTGVAMVEFRRSHTDGQFYLMEVNPRFVGSLDLAVAAGVDLPWLYFQLATGRRVDPRADYRVGLRYQWLLSKNIAQAFENPRGYALRSLSIWRPDTRSDLSLTDPGPHWSHLRAAVWWVRAHRRQVEAPASA
jgi:predicted ATP-grasp superfamily ATP-dependent carboligase